MSVWYQEHGAGVQSGGTAGRSFYTSLGHLNETWQVCQVIAWLYGVADVGSRMICFWPMSLEE